MDHQKLHGSPKRALIAQTHLFAVTRFLQKQDLRPEWTRWGLPLLYASSQICSDSKYEFDTQT